jgi:hypothetical protein
MFDGDEIAPHVRRCINNREDHQIGVEREVWNLFLGSQPHFLPIKAFGLEHPVSTKVGYKAARLRLGHKIP